MCGLVLGAAVVLLGPVVASAQDVDTGDSLTLPDDVYMPPHENGDFQARLWDLDVRATARELARGDDVVVASRVDAHGERLFGPIPPSVEGSALAIPAALFGADPITIRTSAGNRATVEHTTLAREARHLSIVDEHGSPAWDFLGHADSDPGTGAIRWFGSSIDEAGSTTSAVFVLLDGQVLGWFETEEGQYAVGGPVDGPQRVSWLPAGRADGDERRARDTSSVRSASNSESATAMVSDAGGLAAQSATATADGGAPGDFGPVIDILAVFEQGPLCGACVCGAPGCSLPVGTCSPTPNCNATGVIQGAFFSTATPELVSSVAVATIQDALTRSGTGVAVRLVGVQSFPQDLCDNVCDEKDYLISKNASHCVAGTVSGTTQATALRTMRDQAGADLVLVLSASPPSTSTSTGCAANPPDPVVTDGDDDFMMVVEASMGSTTLIWQNPQANAATSRWSIYSHEFGHLLGLAHDRVDGIVTSLPWASPSNWEGGGDPERAGARYHGEVGASYAFGFTSCSSSPVVATQTTMGNAAPSTVCNTSTSTPTITSFQSFNRYSNPYLTLPVSSGPAIPQGSLSQVQAASLPSGLTGPEQSTILARTADAARRIRETAPVVSQYRAAPSLPSPGVLTGPLPGATLPSSGSQSFSWSPSGVVGTSTEQYLFEIGTPASVLVVSPILPMNTTSFAITDMSVLPASPAIIVARLWSRVGTGQWTWNEVRYNTARRWIGCNADPSTEVVYPEMASFGCASGGSPPCTRDVTGSELTCTLANVTGAAPPAMHVAARPTGNARLYDVVVMGQDRAAQGFCCMYSDPTDTVTNLFLTGSSVADQFVLDPAGYDLRSWSSTGLSCDVGGGDGNDLIFGSDSTDSSYDETLRGENGTDTVWGNDGNDILLGGTGNDNLYGGDGFDVLAGKLGTDAVYGDAGWDTLCEQDLGSLLRGRGSANTADWDVLYYVGGLSGTINPSTNVDSPFATCGDDSYSGQNWGHCPTINQLSDPPSACVPFLP